MSPEEYAFPHHYTRLSVNVNKVALLRNSRGGTVPDPVEFARFCEECGAEGITVHPRPDQRHIRYDDVYALREVVTTELNVEGYPDERWMKMVLEVKPHQATLVPDRPEQLTSDHGWDTVREAAFLREIVSELKRAGIRVSIFADPVERMVEGAAEVGADRIELYTGPYAKLFPHNREKAVEPYLKAAAAALRAGLDINAGHDLNLENLAYLKLNIPAIKEVSIGHALISDALYYGIRRTIMLYKERLQMPVKENLIGYRPCDY